METKIFEPRFFLQDTKTVARELLGCVLVHDTEQGRAAGIIVETEAYLGHDDRACHSFGINTPRAGHRTSTMFQTGGVAYVYLIYGMYHCFNVVTEPEGIATAVLIRALAPMDTRENLELMQVRRNTRKIKDLCSGPGKLCQALGITKQQNGLDLRTSELKVLQGEPVSDAKIAVTPRINVDYAGNDALLPLRFVIKDSPFLSTRKFL